MNLSENVTISATTADPLYQSFANPNEKFRTKPLFFWNVPLSEMTKDKVREIVRRSYEESGYEGFGILPYWLEGYLSDEYFELYEAALDEGSKYGMQFSLYDEDGFPSYTAGGLFAKKFPHLTARRLDKYEAEGKAGETVLLKLPEGVLMAAVAMNPDTGERVDISAFAHVDEAGGTDTEGDEAGWYIRYTIPEGTSGSLKIMGFISVVDGTIGMDYLSEEAVAGYIEITHEAYYRRFKRFFENGTITSSFYDEPAFFPWPGMTNYGVQGSRMWTDDFNEYYASLHNGENPALLYPALWYDVGEDSAAARDKLMGTRSEMFAKNYLGQINDWCRAHGIRLMGHMLLEEAINPIPLEGDLMRCFKYQDIPGVDLIGHFGYTQEAYKIVSSVANNWDKTLVMTEAYGAMGEDIPTNILYKCSIDLHTKGINLVVPHAVWYDNVKNVAYPPELSYRNEKFGPMLAEYNVFEARLASLLQREGIHVADAALLYPIDDLETQYTFDVSRDAPSYADYMQVGEYLSLSARRDFTYLHPGVLDTCIVEDGLLTLPNQVNREQFRVVILPSMKSVSLSNLEKINAFLQSGGAVISVGMLPEKGIAASEDERVKEIVTEMFCTASGKAFHVDHPEELADVLDKALSVWDVVLTPSNDRVVGGNLSYLHKVVEGRDLYYIGNSSDSSVTVTVTLRGEFGSMELWDPATGARQSVPVRAENGTTTLDVDLPEVSSRFLVVV